MILPSERARLKLSSCEGCDGTCSCEACSKSKTAAAAMAGEVLVAIKAHEELMNGETVDAGTVVKIHMLVAGNKAWVLEQRSPGRWANPDDSMLVNLHEYRRLVQVGFVGWKGHMNISGFDGDGKRVAGPLMFDPETDAARLADNYRKMADFIEEFAANPRLARVSIGGS